MVVTAQNCGKGFSSQIRAGQGVSCLPKTSTSYAVNSFQVHNEVTTASSRRSAGGPPGFEIYVHRVCAREALTNLTPQQLATNHPALAMLTDRSVALALSAGSVFGVIDTSDDHLPLYLGLDSEKVTDLSALDSAVKADSCVIGVSRNRRVARHQVSGQNFSTTGYSKQVHAAGILLPNAINLAFPVTGPSILGAIQPQIAIIDDGVARSHPDLAANMSPNHYNAYNPQASIGGNPYQVVDSETGGFLYYDAHGTHVAGLAAAVLDGNGVGGAAGRGSQIIAVNALDVETGDFQLADLVNGAQWSINRGAHVLNFSNGGVAVAGSTSTQDDLLLSNAQYNGALVVISAGNRDRFCQFLTVPNNPATPAVELNTTSLNVPFIPDPDEPTKVRCDSQAYTLCRQQSASTLVDSTADPCVYYQAYPYDQDDSAGQSIPIRWLRSRTANLAGVPSNLYLQNYPAALAKNYSCAIAVAATDDAPASSTTLAAFSSYGANTIEIAAPGTSRVIPAGASAVGLLSTVPGDQLSSDTYDAFSGTSMSAPVVSGAAALAYGAILNRTRSVRCPAVCAEVKRLLLETADVVPALQNRVKGGRRLNVQRLIETINTRYPAGSAPLCTQPPTPINSGGLPLCN